MSLTDTIYEFCRNVLHTLINTFYPDTSNMSYTSNSSRRLRDLALGGSDNEGRRLMVTDEEFHDRNVALRMVREAEGENTY